MLAEWDYCAKSGNVATCSFAKKNPKKTIIRFYVFFYLFHDKFISLKSVLNFLNFGLWIIYFSKVARESVTHTHILERYAHCLSLLIRPYQNSSQLWAHTAFWQTTKNPAKLPKPCQIPPKTFWTGSLMISFYTFQGDDPGPHPGHHQDPLLLAPPGQVRREEGPAEARGGHHQGHAEGVQGKKGHYYYFPTFSNYNFGAIKPIIKAMQREFRVKG